jgi:hypothetical protein
MRFENRSGWKAILFGIVLVSAAGCSIDASVGDNSQYVHDNCFEYPQSWKFKDDQGWGPWQEPSDHFPYIDARIRSVNNSYQVQFRSYYAQDVWVTWSWSSETGTGVARKTFVPQQGVSHEQNLEIAWQAGTGPELYITIQNVNRP